MDQSTDWSDDQLIDLRMPCKLFISIDAWTYTVQRVNDACMCWQL